VNTLTENDLTHLKEIEPEVLFVQLAKTASVLPFMAFCAYTSRTTLAQAEEDSINKQAQAMLGPNMFESLKTATIDFDLENLFAPDMDKAGSYVDAAKQVWLDEISEKLSPLPQFSRDRMLRSSLIVDSNSTKSASIIQGSEARSKRLAELYGIYKVAAIAAARNYLGKSTVDDQVLLTLNYCT
jgi:hypothetical protein